MASMIGDKKTIQFDGHTLPVDTAASWDIGGGSRVVSVLVNEAGEKPRKYFEYEIDLGTDEKVRNLVQQLLKHGIKYKVRCDLEKISLSNNGVQFSSLQGSDSPNQPGFEFAKVANIMRLNVSKKTKTRCTIKEPPERLEKLFDENVVAKQLGIAPDRYVELADIDWTYEKGGISMPNGQFEPIGIPTAETAKASLRLVFKGNGPAVTESRYLPLIRLPVESLTDQQIAEMIDPKAKKQASDQPVEEKAASKA